jgi:sterol desaturase/sphingolipid hydroxylase (fatty acid hydroxylase superfamily)
MMHEFHLAWLPHSVHHSGEDYNLATGLRQGAIQSAFSWIWYTPLALLGFNPVAFAAHRQLNTLYM